MMKKNWITVILTANFLILTMLSPFASFAHNCSTPTAEVLWDRLKTVNPGLQDYSVDVKIGVNVKFLLVNPDLNLEGNYYFKKPDKHKLKLKKSYNFLEKYPNIFGWELPDLSIHNSTVREVVENGKQFYVVTITPKEKRSDLQKEEYWIDPVNYTVPRQIYTYDNNGRITVNVNYRRDGGYWLYDRMNANFSFPSMKLTARAAANYGRYQTNVGLNDEFFAVNK
jgi:outer membrane lipoprotein-sorting protein